MIDANQTRIPYVKRAETRSISVWLLSALCNVRIHKNQIASTHYVFERNRKNATLCRRVPAIDDIKKMYNNCTDPSIVHENCGSFLHKSLEKMSASRETICESAIMVNWCTIDVVRIANKDFTVQENAQNVCPKYINNNIKRRWWTLYSMPRTMRWLVHHLTQNYTPLSTCGIITVKNEKQYCTYLCT